MKKIVIINKNREKRCDSMKSAYIHIPFCKKICTYCDFCKMIYNNSWIMQYLDALESEINDNYDGEKLKSIYIGGGTPSCLNNDELIKLLNIINVFQRDDDIEFTFECNLCDINENLLGILKKSGVNRLSIGIESFDSRLLEIMNRSADYDDALSKINLCRKVGFDNINIDLIYGFNIEDVSMLKSDIKKILKLQPEHISTYSLIIEDNTQMGISKIKPIDQDLDAKMYDTICKMLKRKGYNHYEISNFSKIGYESFHNINYWKNNEYYGFGLGAHGYIMGFRYENTRSLNDYLKGKFHLNENILSKEEKMQNELMLSLRLKKGINIKEFYHKFGTNIQQVFDFNEVINNKDIIYKNGYIFIPENKFYVMNEILLKLL